MKKALPYILITIIPLAIAAVAYIFLPDMIPVHLSFSGVDRYANKIVVFLFALLPLVIYSSYKMKRR